MCVCCSCSAMRLLGFFFVGLWMLQLLAAQPTDPDEVTALNKMIDNWNLRSKLNFTIDPCTQNASWASNNANPRVACGCSGTTCHITHLKIYALDISGEIPPELFVLKKLVDLNLGQNVLNGTIPAEIEQLSNMQYLSLGINNLTGRVPPELGKLTELISLSFSSNSLTGQLPKELGNLTSLRELYIDSSGLSGPIPKELSNLKSLQILWASDNLFTGKLPEFLGTFVELKDLRLQGTLLDGPIPSNFGSLTKLEDLRIGDLENEDSTLDFLGSQTSLSVISLRNCRVSGQIPERLSIFAKLQSLDLSFNKLTGEIPMTFQDLPSLQFLYLGNNNLSGQIPPDITSTKLIALDISFNPISGDVPQNFDKVGFSMNVVGTSVSTKYLQEMKTEALQQCLYSNAMCGNYIIPHSSFSINCGGREQTSASGIKFDDESEILGAASYYVSSDVRWAVSSTGQFISNPNGPQYIANTDSQITETLDSELYKTARTSPSSLRYYGLGLKNGKYGIELHFAEITIGDTRSWKSLGKRLFDVYIQVLAQKLFKKSWFNGTNHENMQQFEFGGIVLIDMMLTEKKRNWMLSYLHNNVAIDEMKGEKVLQDFNIQNEAGGSKRALVKTFEANVTNGIMDIHFFWAGRGTCCIPLQGTYGPLVSAIHVSQVSDGVHSSSGSNKKRVGKLVGIIIGCAVGVVLISSAFYIWWTKDSSGQLQVHRESLKR